METHILSLKNYNDLNKKLNNLLIDSHNKTEIANYIIKVINAVNYDNITYSFIIEKEINENVWSCHLQKAESSLLY